MKPLPGSLSASASSSTAKPSASSELTESLRTRENSIARACGSVLIADIELLVTETRRFLSEGAPNTLPAGVIEFLVEQRVRQRLVP